MAEGNLTGNYHVRAIRPAFQDAHHWFPRTRDRAEVRRHALKLRFWPQRYPTDDNGTLLDLDWEWIKALSGLRIGELRIGDCIGGHDNIRVIFFAPQIPSEPKPILWILSVFQKKRNDFTEAQLRMYKLRRTIVLQRFYDT